MATITRLAVIEQGEPAVRVLAAIGNLNQGAAARVTTVLVYWGSSPPWYAREADAVLAIPPGDAPLSGPELAAALVNAGIDGVWPGELHWSPPLADLVEASTAAGLTVVGPDAATIRQLTDPAALATAGAAVGVEVDCAAEVPSARVLEVDTLTDSHGTTWTLGVRDVSLRRDGQLVLAELPAPRLPQAADVEDAARRLVGASTLRGAAVVRFAVAPEGRPVCVGVVPLGRPEHALIEEATGASVIGLQLRVALGESLPADQPQVDGHTVEVRVLGPHARTDGHASADTVALLSMPVGTGVRVDTSLRVGDTLDPAADRHIATISSWGRDRPQALARLARALERTGVILSGGPTNRPLLLALVRHPDVLAGPLASGWLNEALTAGKLTPPPDPMALVAAAVEVYDADLALARATFRTTAARGRPQPPEAVGAKIQLCYHGIRHTLRADRVAADRYRIHEGATLEATVEWISEYERRIAVGNRKVRVLASDHENAILLEIDGVAHRVVREDGQVVRTEWPALVESILVKPGDAITAGAPIVVLESMKMLTTVLAPFSGVVSSVAVLANAQVERGAALLRIRATGGADGAYGADGSNGAYGAAGSNGAYGAAGAYGSNGAAGAYGSNGAAGAAGSNGTYGSGCSDGSDAEGDATTTVGLRDLLTDAGELRHAQVGVFGPLRDYLLGFDLDPAGRTAAINGYQRLAATSAPDDPTLLAEEGAFLDLFAEIGSLYRPRVEEESGPEADVADQLNTQEYFLAFLQWLDADRAGLPDGYRRRLERALRRYGVATLADRAGLERATMWMFRSFTRVPDVAAVVVAILERHLAQTEALHFLATSQTRERLERLAAATAGRQHAVTDLARDLLFHLFDEPILGDVIEQTQAEMRGHLVALADDPTRADRSDRIGRLVWSPHPMRSLLLAAWRSSLTDPNHLDGAAFRRAILETYARRFYRMRALHGLDFATIDGVEIAFANYEHEGRDHHLVVGYHPFDEVPALSRALATHLASAAFQREAVVDLVTWRAEECPEIEDLAADAGELLAESNFGRSLHRLDLTITSLSGGGDDRLRTQHLTFRQGLDGGFVEDLLHRNLHPMLGKRLDLWRFANFVLRRLPSPEDIYLFDGVAKENPKDHRLFALAEVRDLTPVRIEAANETTYPRLGRMGLAALAAMRAALASYPTRERPVANRLVLSIRPTWTIPATDWYPLARTYEGLARGAGLEKVVLHVSAPERAADGHETLHNKILVIEGLGGSGLSIRIDEPGPNPVRALTAYAQKVLTSARFGVPYPYEIVRMLTPQVGDSSPFPPGTFQELDLDEAADELVPVDRPPAQNTAHLVVGLLTTFTHVHPDGITRVALLSDPTQGLGNLAEPECRRINAALAYAQSHRIPVEWYAVSSGALIALDSGTENMDWIALTLRRIIEFTQSGGEINIIVTGINVGGQPYWNAEATMLMHTKGILIMTPASAMVLTGKQALDFSGAVSAEDNAGIGGYDRVMGLNGQAQYWAPSFPDACALLLAHYDFTYVVPGERFPRRRPTQDALDRDVRTAAHTKIANSTFTRVGDVFDAATNPDRKQPFDMRSVMRAVTDTDCQPLERWQAWQDADTSIVWDATIGGFPVCLLGLESHTLPRRGFVPSYGPPSWTSGTLFPQSSRKTARAINAVSGNRPLVVLANLSGFDGSPESLRNWQLEYGAEIGRAVTNFDGPIVFVVVSRYHGGAFVVFSKALTDSMEIAAVEGSYASVIGGAPAAATVFARDVKLRTDKDARVVAAKAAAASASGSEAASLRLAVTRATAQARSERLREVADEFDAIHTIERAQRVGSVDRIIPAATLRPYLIDALERGIAKATAG